MSVKFELSYLKSLPIGYPLGAATLFDCSDPHHDLIGKSWLLCQPSGTKAEWNGAIPYCGNNSYLVTSKNILTLFKSITLQRLLATR